MTNETLTVASRAQYGDSAMRMLKARGHGQTHL